MTDRLLRARASQVVDRAVSTLEQGMRDGVSVNAADVSRRGFLRAGSTSLAMALLAGCDSKGPDSAQKLLDFATRRNEVVERWLLRHTAMDHARASAVNAGAQFPSYFISKVVPTWDAAANGAWMLEVDGLVRTPLTLSLAQLMAQCRAMSCECASSVLPTSKMKLKWLLPGVVSTDQVPWPMACTVFDARSTPTSWPSRKIAPERKSLLSKALASLLAPVSA